jgi:hypothetical protein
MYPEVVRMLGIPSAGWSMMFLGKMTRIHVHRGKPM